MKFAAIIPARYASSRFPGKPLAMLGGKAVINRVVERVQAAGIPALVATDDERILQAVRDAGAQAVITRADHLCGTDRVREAADSLSPDVDVIINVQGDEPFIHPDQIKALCSLFERYPDTDIATLVRPLPSDTPYSRLADPALVKAVTSTDGQALYFSRFPVPFQRGIPEEEWAARHRYLGAYRHIRLPRRGASAHHEAAGVSSRKGREPGAAALAAGRPAHTHSGVRTPHHRH